LRRLLIQPTARSTAITSIGIAAARNSLLGGPNLHTNFINTVTVVITVTDDDTLDELLDELDGHTDLEKANQQVSISVDERRYGKAVTIVSGFDVPQSEIKSLASSLKSSLATGGTVDDDTIELQGDHRDRLPELLADHGYDVG